MDLKNEYSLSDIVSKKFRNITNEEKMTLEKAKIKILMLSSFCSLYYNVDSNLRILINYLENKEQTTSIKDYSNNMLFADVNRITSNFLASFYSLIEFFEKRLTSFSNFKTDIYDTHFSYRLFYEMRKYITHQGFAITKISSFFCENAINIKAIFDSNKLIESSDCNAKFKKELKQLENKELILINQCNDFESTLKAILHKVIENEELEIKDAYNTFENAMKKTPTRNGECYLIKDNKPIWSLRKVLNKSLSDYYSGILLEESIKNLEIKLTKEYLFFKELCAIYFDNEGAIPTFMNID